MKKANIIIEEHRTHNVVVRLSTKKLHKEIARGIYNGFGALFSIIGFTIAISQGEWVSAAILFVSGVVLLAL